MEPQAEKFAVWDVVRVEFPYADEARVRRRPGLVIAAREVVGAFTLIWILMITSARHGLWPLDAPISDLSSAGLPHPCVIRPAKVATFDARLATRIGRLAGVDQPTVARALRAILGDAVGGVTSSVA